MLQRTISPVDGSLFVERELADEAALDRILSRAEAARGPWRETPLAERQALCTRFVDALVSERDAIARELTWQMGRPIRYSPGELRGFEERARTMIALAPDALRDVAVGEKAGFTRFIRREPLGVVLAIAAWNYPYLIAVNAVVPALLAGNPVILKHSAQTPLVAERFGEAFAKAGLPDGVFQHVHTSHALVAKAVADPRVAFVAFTGSVEGGRAVHEAAASRFVACGLELGGKDPAYVRHDADLDHAVENLVDGAMFNSGQSCCGIERIYVHEALYDAFVDGFVALTRQYVLGDPTDPATTLGPVVRASAAAAIQAQIAEAVTRGARALIEPHEFPKHAPGTPYLAPQVLVDVDHDMAVMRDETFGPVVGIMKVRGGWDCDRACRAGHASHRCRYRTRPDRAGMGSRAGTRLH